MFTIMHTLFLHTYCNSFAQISRMISQFLIDRNNQPTASMYSHWSIWSDVGGNIYTFSRSKMAKPPQQSPKYCEKGIPARGMTHINPNAQTPLDIHQVPSLSSAWDILATALSAPESTMGHSPLSSSPFSNRILSHLSSVPSPVDASSPCCLPSGHEKNWSTRPKIKSKQTTPCREF